jgi:hypothetical protein
LTELPKRWCIKLINSEELLDWINKNSNENILFDDMVENPIRYLYFHYPFDVNPFKGIPVRLKDNSYTEITFDKFKKWVLKKINNGGDCDLIPVITHIDTLLEKEKQQILDAHMKGQLWNECQKYYSDTFNNND